MNAYRRAEIHKHSFDFVTPAGLFQIALTDSSRYKTDCRHTQPTEVSLLLLRENAGR